MTGAGRAHNLIVRNSFVQLRQGLRGKPCSVYVADLKLQIDADSAAYVHPDPMVACDPRDAGPEADSCIRHPWLVLEVLSVSTANYDRGKNFELYRQVVSITHYLLVEQTRPYAELFRKNEEGQWVLFPLGTADVPCIEQSHAFIWPMIGMLDGVAFDVGRAVAAVTGL